MNNITALDIFCLAFISLVLLTLIILFLVIFIDDIKDKIRITKYHEQLAKDKVLQQLIHNKKSAYKAYEVKHNDETLIKKTLKDMLLNDYLMYVPDSEKKRRLEEIERTKKIWWETHLITEKLHDRYIEADKELKLYCSENNITID